jgi:hypothetical protein
MVLLPECTGHPLALAVYYTGLAVWDKIVAMWSRSEAHQVVK